MKQDTYPLGINTTETGRLLFSETYVTVAVMHQSIPAAPSPPPPPTPLGCCGVFARLFSPGGRAFATFALPGCRAFANPGANPELLTRTRFPLTRYYTEDFTGKTNRLAHLSRTGKN